jgi:SAM-dependent methyltransferase
MMDAFDKDYWEAHWEEAAHREYDRGLLPNPYLAREIGDLPVGTALDAGCGEGAEAIWLAVTGWQVTAADISAAALDRARRRAGEGERAAEIEWVEADVSVWEPDCRFDLVMTHYAHPSIGQLAFYERIAEWVAPGGTLLIVGHLHHHDHSGGHTDVHDHGGRPPAQVQVTADAVTDLLDPDEWEVVTADEATRTLRNGSGRTVELHDVVVRATRGA